MISVEIANLWDEFQRCTHFVSEEVEAWRDEELAERSHSRKHVCMWWGEYIGAEDDQEYKMD